MADLSIFILLLVIIKLDYSENIAPTTFLHASTAVTQYLPTNLRRRSIAYQ